MSSIILQAHSLTKKYRHTVALDHIDLQIEKGKIYGFIGQNGAGKTTAIDCIFAVAYLAIQISTNKTANPQSIKTDS